MAEVFSPQVTSTVTAGSGAAVNVSLKSSGSPCSVRIANPTGNQIMYVKFGVSTDAATTSDMPILPGSIEVFQMQSNQTHLSAISAGASSTLYLTVGRGE